MDLAAFSPRKLNLLNHSPPRTPIRKRSLFPTNSPQTNDLGLISELGSDNSDVYSPPLVSPSSSVTPDKYTSPSMKVNSNNVLRVANNIEFSNSPKKSSKKISCNKENMSVFMSARKSVNIPLQKSLLEEVNFDDHFSTILQHSPEKLEMRSSDNLTTPKNNTSLINKVAKRSPHSASKLEVTIRPNNFYGNLAPILATNQTNRIQGMKCVFRPPQQSRAKTKLLFEEKPIMKRERSRSTDVMREAKRRKAIFTGVHHAIPKPVKYSPPAIKTGKHESIREKAYKVTDFSHTPYGNKKKKQEGWEYTLRFTKPMRREENLGEKRKFFSPIVQEKLSSPGSPSGILSPNIPKKRKLLDTRRSFLDENSSQEVKINATDIAELIEDHDVDKFQEKPEVDDILLRLEEEDEEEKKKECERQMLMNILEDSPIKTAMIDSLSDCTASLDLNDSFSGSGCSRFDLEENKENKNNTLSTPRRVFSVFNGVSSNIDQGSSSTKKKWHGVGKHQLQIDAGQKSFGALQCTECGMVYQMGEAEDEMQHESFHNNLKTLRHTSWKNENVVGCYGLDYTLVITENDPKSWQQKALDVITLVDKSLGITSDIPNVMHNQKVFLYISNKRIVGCMVANPVSRAYKMICSESDVDICSEESYPVRCGISRMWTLFCHRRQGVASKLLDTVRCNFMYGCILPKDEIAFSIPTPDGKGFATKYMGSPNFFVYTGY